MGDRRYTFEEKAQEISAKTGKSTPVCVTSRYERSKAKAIKLIEEGRYALDESDFWILKNENKDGSTVYYTGLVITHNACTKINNKLPKDQRFRPSCVTVDKNGYGGSLVYTYVCDEQGIYEVGEVSSANCKNPYMNCMALKRLQDRVILKLSALAEDGIYSEDESDDFKEELPVKAPKQESDVKQTAQKDSAQSSPKKTAVPYGKSIEQLKISKEQANQIKASCDEHGLSHKSLCKALGISKIEDLRAIDYNNCIDRLAATPYYNKENKAS